MFGISVFMAYWIHSLDDVTNDQLATLQACIHVHTCTYISCGNMHTMHM